MNYTYGSPPGVVGGLFKSNLTLPPTAYVSFKTIARGPTPKDFDSALQKYYLQNLASYLGGSPRDVVILKIDGGPTAALNTPSGPAPPGESLIHHDPASSPLGGPSISYPGPASGPLPEASVPAQATGRRSLLQDEVADPNAPTLIIWTAVTLSTSDVLKFVDAIQSNTTDILDPEDRINGPNTSFFYVSDAIYGVANPGFTPHVAAGSPIVTFQAYIDDNLHNDIKDDTGPNRDTSYLFPLVSAAVLSSILQPDLTAIQFLTVDNFGNITATLAVAFNGLPTNTASQAATAFAAKLNASASNHNRPPIATPPSFAFREAFNVNQSVADSYGGFYTPAEDSIIYNPYVGTSAGSKVAVTPNTNAVVNFTATIESYTMDTWTGVDGTSPTGQERYLYTLDTYLRTNTNPYAYAEVNMATSGSVNAPTGVVIPYSNTDPTSASDASLAVTNLKSTLTSNSAQIFDAATFGSVTASDITSSGEDYSV
ncbi:hypothetical protein WJX84_011573 [Apatococcus fuscideae]|uniref:Uncharacterized protein n=1 Tax=Apatococcus fuscideae TaxID=2026836 RepID=A0AAW1T807_9CHLO